jgi:hypothetical protein
MGKLIDPATTRKKITLSCNEGEAEITCHIPLLSPTNH